jgi:hypothetical protein
VGPTIAGITPAKVSQFIYELAVAVAEVRGNSPRACGANRPGRMSLMHAHTRSPPPRHSQEKLDPTHVHAALAAAGVPADAGDDMANALWLASVRFERSAGATERLADLVKTCQVGLEVAPEEAWLRGLEPSGLLPACRAAVGGSGGSQPPTPAAARARAPCPAPQERGRVSRRLLLETQELPLLEASGLVVGAGFKTREVRTHTKTTYQQSK